MTLAYRGVDQIAESRFTAIRQKLAAETADLEPLVRVCARRQARIVGGGVAVAFGAVGFLASFLPVVDSGTWFGQEGSGAATYVFLAAWPAAALATWIARMVSRGVFLRHLAAPGARTGDALADLVRAEQFEPQRVLAGAARRRERLSVALPLAGIALLAPLTIHFFVGRLLAGSSGGDAASEFEGWIRASALLVGHAHIVLAVCGFGFARRLVSRETASIAKGTSHDGLVAVGWTTLASLVPGAILFLVPPALVLFTGLAFAPLAYSVMGRRICAERLVLGAAVGGGEKA